MTIPGRGLSEGLHPGRVKPVTGAGAPAADGGRGVPSGEMLTLGPGSGVSQRRVTGTCQHEG